MSVTEKVISDTLCIIESTVSDTAKETAYDKLKRMILGKVESQKININRQSFTTVKNDIRIVWNCIGMFTPPAITEKEKSA